MVGYSVEWMDVYALSNSLHAVCHSRAVYIDCCFLVAVIYWQALGKAPHAVNV